MPADVGAMPSGTATLFDAEIEANKARQALLVSVTHEIEAIFLRENMSMGELLEVFGLFTARANDVFSKIQIKEIKEKYGK